MKIRMMQSQTMTRTWMMHIYQQHQHSLIILSTHISHTSSIIIMPTNSMCCPHTKCPFHLISHLPIHRKYLFLLNQHTNTNLQYTRYFSQPLLSSKQSRSSKISQVFIPHLPCFLHFKNILMDHLIPNQKHLSQSLFHRLKNLSQQILQTWNL